MLCAACLARAEVQPILPTIPDGIYNITNYGAVGDSMTTNTAAIQAAINAAATSPAKGGTVEIPAGVFLSGPLNLSNNINLQVDSSAVLVMLPYGQYPGTAALVTGNKVHDIEISGSGTMDGQGAPWWPGYKTNSRPVMVNFSACNRVLIQDVTLQNSPMQHMVIKGKAGNVTIQRVTVLAPSSSAATNPSHNTDALDLAETNCVMRDCYISTGDDNLAVGSSASVSRDILVTNCTFGTGHGVSIGSYTSSGVSNMTVINCSFTGTDNGIRIKSDNDRGGIVQNLCYLNLTMTNVNVPITIYGYYNEYGTVTRITPQTAAGQTVSAVTGLTPIYRNILFSNVTVTGSSSIAGIIWGRTELPITNVTMSGVTMSVAGTFDLYNAQGIKWIDSQIGAVQSGNPMFTLYNAGVIASNSTPLAGWVSVGGLTSSNSLALYNTLASMSATNLLGANPITLSGSVLLDSTDLVLPASSIVNFGLGTNATEVVVSSNLTLSGAINIVDGGGFGVGSYPLFSYSGSLSGSLKIGAQPAGFVCALDTSTPGLVNLIAYLRPPVTGWGYDGFGQSDIAPSLTNTTAVAAGGYHSLALHADGTVAAWGDDWNHQCDVPRDLTNVVAIAAGGYHSLALRADGTVAAWGDDSSGQTDTPASATNVVAISAGDWHSLALRADGSVVGWGDNSWGQTDIPAEATNLVAIAAGGQHSLGLKADGTVLAWGSDVGPYGGYAGQTDVPINLSRVVAIAAGGFHSLALKDDGTVSGWGDNSQGQTTIPGGLANVIAIAAGGSHSLALQAGGVVLAWGDNLDGQTTVDSTLTGINAIAAGGYHTLALSGQTPTGPRIASAARKGSACAVSLPTIRGKAYFLQYKNSLNDAGWTPLTAVAGDGKTRSLIDSGATVPLRFYRIRQQ